MKVSFQIDTKKRLIIIGAVVLAALVGMYFLIGGTEHIEDTNGSENFTLQQITDENIIREDMGAIGGPDIFWSEFTGDDVKISAEKFTGVYEILYDHFLFPSDFDLSLTDYEIYGGNVKLAIIHDDELVAVLEPGDNIDYRLEDVSGRVSLRIAGESAAFTIHINHAEYNSHSQYENAIRIH